MSIDRRIDLDSGLASRFAAQEFDTSAGNYKPGSQASEQDRQAFERALAAGTPTPEPKTPATAPFALFGAAPVPGTPAAAPAPSALSDALAQCANQLLVAEEGGRREVRIELQDEVLPGVSLSVFEDEGRLVAAFTCANESSRERLVASAPALAAEMAASLSRATLVQVQTDDPDDRCLIEARADAPA